ncbi:potassium-transporting ATPase subunit KdpA [Pseudoxanthomonas kaohsiungensis]|uniref:Potassium-transporting ATPase potassium-binding subunit n=1 Tax=Pseudoxanthomonas kaohsiungensis TaxID=283923 RepID=A0ABW3LY02_9GAMM|nr:potassium-transporting ATPase subunit KdpA [Pseudoxanthomonas kaohsiungensis]KAF1700135.1 potassium-transporting ATPase subunit KdpA [Pseudoxanthomonas kaohsiungensis]
MIEFFTVFALAIALGWPLGRYLAAVMRGAPMRVDRLFGWIERPLYRLFGTDPARGMDWKAYATAFLASNVVLGGIVWIVLMTQAWLPFNPNEAPNMRWDLALHTMVSFLTNTNQQHYSGQAQLSFLSHAMCITGLQVVTPMMGLALVVATLRGLFGGRAPAGDALSASSVAAGARPWMAGQGDPQPAMLRHGGQQPDSMDPRRAMQQSGAADLDVGNYWADVLRPTVRFMLPLALAWSLLLTWQGVPATLQGGPVAAPVDAQAEMAAQKIPLGPVAPMVAIKQLGTNGGGWYGPNSAVPLENPTPFSNVLQTLALILVPVSVAFMVSPFTGRRKFTALVFGTMLGMSLVSTGLAMWSEAHSSTAADIALMEGKEVRFGAEASALWATLTTQTSNGSVNSMHDSLAPLTGLVTIGNMLVNSTWGGIGCGLQQFLVYLLLAVFLAGLMTGRTPELFGRKIEAGEVKLLAVLVVLQPLVLLGLTALALAVPSITGNSNPSFHGISQVFYEYTSAFANNGSGFEGLGDATYWWNLSCVVVLALGRYPALIIPLVIAARLGAKRAAVADGPGTLQVETPTFALTLVAVIVILTLLQFMPALVLGPVADHLSLAMS